MKKKKKKHKADVEINNLSKLQFTFFSFTFVNMFTMKTRQISALAFNTP